MQWLREFRRPVRSISALRVLVGMASLLLTWLRPSAEDRALRSARDHLDLRNPGAFCVLGISKNSPFQSPDGWTVTYGDVAGRGPSTFGFLHVDALGRVRRVTVFVD